MRTAKFGLRFVQVIIWVANGLGAAFVYLLAMMASDRRVPEDLQHFAALLMVVMLLTLPMLGLIKFLLKKISAKEETDPLVPVRAC